MDDLIKREKIFEHIKAVCLERDGGALVTSEDFLKMAIKDIPSAENKGEWKHLKGDEWLCSNCGYVVWTEGSWEHPLERGKDYCEHCGTRMKGADDED